MNKNMLIEQLFGEFMLFSKMNKEYKEELKKDLIKLKIKTLKLMIQCGEIQH